MAELDKENEESLIALTTHFAQVVYQCTCSVRVSMYSVLHTLRVFTSKCCIQYTVYTVVIECFFCLLYTLLVSVALL